MSSLWMSTNENPYHSCYIVFQYVMMKIFKCVYIIRLIRYRRNMLMWDLNVNCYLVTYKNKWIIFKAVYRWEGYSVFDDDNDLQHIEYELNQDLLNQETWSKNGF